MGISEYSFLQSNANYWIKKYHFDGLRVDALSNIIYWQGNPDRGENGNAIAFIRNMNKGLKEQYPSIILAAENSTAYPMVTGSVEKGGLGFDYKWDMGWMNDTLKFMQQNPGNRTNEYHKLTFSMMYYYSEKFILPLSHDEVVHGKATIVQKMNGEYEKKFPQARVLYMYMYAHPGKKLNFMGNEFAQLREWDDNFSNKGYRYRIRTEKTSRIKLLVASDNESYGGNVQYKNKEIYTAKANVFLIPMGEFSAKYFLAEDGN